MDAVAAIAAVTAKIISDIQTKCALKINLYDKRIGTKNRTKIIDALKSSSVTKLDLTEVLVSHKKGYHEIKNRYKCKHEEEYKDRCREIAGIIASASSQLVSINLSRNNMGNEAVRDIICGLKQSSLTKLDLSYNDIEDEGAKEIAHALLHTMLRWLDLSCNDITHVGVRAIGEVLNSSSITYLNLSSNRIENKGARAIFAGLAHSQLTKLCLTGNNITDEGVKEIAHALSNSPLLSLNLSGNRIGNRGAIKIAEGLQNSALNHLYLYRNQIRVEGITAIMSATVGSSLRSLSLDGNASYNNRDTIELLKDTGITAFSLATNSEIETMIENIIETNLHSLRFKRTKVVQSLTIENISQI